MERDPSIHITLSAFKEVLVKLGLTAVVPWAEYIFRAAAPYSVKGRYPIVDNVKTRKKVQRHKAAADVAGITVDQFNQLLTSCRDMAGHRNYGLIRKGDSQHIQLQEVLKLAHDFCKDHKIEDLHEGCKFYLSTGIALMRKTYGLNKFKYYNQKIGDVYTATSALHHDPDRERTREMANTYLVRLTQTHRIDRKVTRTDEYVHFLWAREAADSVDANISNWIEAVFEDYSRRGLVPEPYHLHGDYAEKCYVSYVLEQVHADKMVDAGKYDRGKVAAFEQRYAELANQT